jgi:hypothetical protein
MIHPKLLRPDRRTPSQVFWARYPGLVWSNPEADDSAHISAELLRPHFTTLLAVAIEFGLDRLKEQWEQLLSTGEPAKVQRARPLVERILHNIEQGFLDASERYG